MANPQPKFDLKMLVLPAMMFLNGKIDFKDPQVLNYTQIAFVSGKWIFWQKSVDATHLMYDLRFF